MSRTKLDVKKGEIKRGLEEKYILKKTNKQKRRLDWEKGFEYREKKLW